MSMRLPYRCGQVVHDPKQIPAKVVNLAQTGLTALSNLWLVCPPILETLGSIQQDDRY